ncbi:hypothetical protein PROFUN_08598 [Planoprotostelium fungivorum]|uniref:Uncharacterized protein n=1 Tax=Planoprotostelium fungivorum TaxID=1890364 RepID=A0A2P6NJ81_9EUKA|nr:hypothetical protein PROFUN_08598 [Planoprotostelium fungivorum]
MAEQMEPASFPPFELVVEWVNQLWREEVVRERAIKMCRDPSLSIEDGDFRLMQPLKSRQRKHLTGESKDLSPRPIIALRRESPLTRTMKQCVVTVRLLDSDGAPLSREEQTGLITPDGPQRNMILSRLQTAPFTIKLSQHLEERKLRLGFDIDYTTKEGQFQAKISSNCFQFGRDRRLRHLRQSV